MKPGRLLSLVLSLVLVAVGIAIAAPSQPRPSGFSETTQVVAVEIPVQVTRDGEPVRGLKAADFEVYEGKKKLPIVGFDVVDLDAPKQPVEAGLSGETSPALGGRRHILLLFDLANSDPSSIVKAESAVSVALKDLTSSDLVALATYSPTEGTRLLLNFTTNREQLAAALRRVGTPSVADRGADPLRLLAEMPLSLQAGVMTPSTALPAAAAVKDAARDAGADYLAHATADSARADREQRLAMISAMSRAYADLARLMAGISGRKEVVLLSQGFDPSLLQGTTSQPDVQSIGGLTSEERVEMNVDSDQRFGSTHGSNELEKTMEAFRRADCAIQAVNIGGVSAPGAAPSGGSSQAPSLAMQKLGATSESNLDNGLAAPRPNGDAGLFQMAHDTGGELYRNFNDLSTALTRLLHKTSVTYLLTIQPEGLAQNGAYHPIKVVLKQSPRGTLVSARPGYYAPARASRPSALERTLAAGNELMSAPGSGGVTTSVLALPFRSHGDKAYVPVLIETDGMSLLGDMLANAVSPPPVPTEIYTYAFTPDGSVADFFVAVLSLDLIKVGDTVRSTGVKYFGHLELAPGRYDVRSLVRNGLSGAYGVSVESLTVPDFTAGRAVLLGPLFLEPFDKWLMVKEGPRGDLQQEPYPFMAGNQAFLPASLPRLTPGETATLELVGWNWGSTGPEPHGRVLDRSGKEVVAGGVKLALEPVITSEGKQTVRTHFVTPQLPPGAYSLVIDLGPNAPGNANGPFMVVDDPLRPTGHG